MQRLHHEGTRFINENGNEVILHGINVLHNMHQDLFREGNRRGKYLYCNGVR